MAWNKQYCWCLGENQIVFAACQSLQHDSLYQKLCQMMVYFWMLNKFSTKVYDFLQKIKWSTSRKDIKWNNLFKCSLLKLALKYLERMIQVFDPKVSYQQRWNIDYANHLCLLFQKFLQQFNTYYFCTYYSRYCYCRYWIRNVKDLNQIHWWFWSILPQLVR